MYMYGVWTPMPSYVVNFSANPNWYQNAFSGAVFDVGVPFYATHDSMSALHVRYDQDRGLYTILRPALRLEPRLCRLLGEPAYARPAPMELDRLQARVHRVRDETVLSVVAALTVSAVGADVCQRLRKLADQHRVRAGTRSASRWISGTTACCQRPITGSRPTVCASTASLRYADLSAKLRERVADVALSPLPAQVPVSLRRRLLRTTATASRRWTEARPQRRASRGSGYVYPKIWQHFVGADPLHAVDHLGQADQHRAQVRQTPPMVLAAALHRHDNLVGDVRAHTAHHQQAAVVSTSPTASPTSATTTAGINASRIRRSRTRTWQPDGTTYTGLDAFEDSRPRATAPPVSSTLRTRTSR